jgi:hypothetical protein
MTKNNSNQSLFASQEVTNSVGGANQLNKTAQLTSMSSQIAGMVLQSVLANQEKYSAQVVASQSSHDEMDRLVQELGELSTIELDFLQVESDEALDKMLKSQQSKRSRSKSKAMTQDNYTTMLTAAVAENLLRMASGKTKGAAGGPTSNGDPRYTEQELEALSENPENLSKAIRNVQSKKSIAKSKADFDPESDRWTMLLEAEAQLKDMRATISGVASVESKAAVETNRAVEDMLAEQDLENMTAEDALALLAKTKEMLASK